MKTIHPPAVHASTDEPVAFQNLLGDLLLFSLLGTATVAILYGTFTQLYDACVTQFNQWMLAFMTQAHPAGW